MFACTLFNGQEKGSNLLSITTFPIGKTKCMSETGQLGKCTEKKKDID